MAATESAADRQFRPATSTTTILSSCNAAVIVFSVADFSRWLSCSAMTRTLMLYHLCFVSEFRYQFSHIRHLDSGAALGGFFNLEDFKPGRDIHSKHLGFDHLKRFFLGLHDIGQLHVPGFVEPQISRDH